MGLQCEKTFRQETYFGATTTLEAKPENSIFHLHQRVKEINQ